MKILFAAGNRIGSYFQFKRFYDTIKEKDHIVKIAAYDNFHGDFDFNLSSVLNFLKPNTISFNGNYSYLHNEIKRFAPDLVLSDLEIFCSMIAIELNIKLFQCSPILLYYGINNELKNKLSIYKNYSYLFNSNKRKIEYINYILNNSDKKLVYSHLCDITSPPKLNEGFEFVRPDFLLDDDKINLDIIAISPENNKSIIHEIKNKNSLYYTSYIYECYEKLKLLDIYNDVSINCRKLILDGTTTFLADAFYNQKYCNIVPRLDIECIIGSLANEYFDLGKITTSDKLFSNKEINININDKVKFLSEII
jgi:hypothetical protein